MLPTCTTLDLKIEGHALRLTLNRPAARNALSAAMWREIDAVFTALEADRAIRLVILRGAGGYFCAGRDLKEAPPAAASNDAEATLERNLSGGRILARINRAPQVVLSVVEGGAFGGGAGLVCASDIVLGGASARFALPETTLGLLPAQILPFLVQRIGRAQTRRLALTASPIGAAEAYRIGLVDEVLDDTQALEAAIERYIGQVGQCAPLALAATKKLLGELDAGDLETQLRTAAAAFTAASSGSEAREAQLARREGRAPNWSVQA